MRMNEEEDELRCLNLGSLSKLDDDMYFVKRVRIVRMMMTMTIWRRCDTTSKNDAIMYGQIMVANRVDKNNDRDGNNIKQ